jgi:hypothetical protein
MHTSGYFVFILQKLVDTVCMVWPLSGEADMRLPSSSVILYI